jgi:endonuclease III
VEISTRETHRGNQQGLVPEGKGLPSVRRVRAVHRRLTAAYGPFRQQERAPIVDCLIGTVLSQHTSDANSARAFASLKQRFGSWDRIAEAPVDDIEQSIRSGGLAKVKAPRIQEILRAIQSRERHIDLTRLEEMSDTEVDDYLRTLPGVGPKTIACVMAFSMRRSAFPVDTHVHRVTRRLGWVAPTASAEETARALTSRIPAELRYELHVGLIEHGRRICRSRLPLCSRCVLYKLCDSGPRLRAAGVAR